MKYIYFIIFTILLSSCVSQRINPSDREDVRYYPSTIEFVRNSVDNAPVYTKIRKKGVDFLQIKGIFNGETENYVKGSDTAWAIRLDSQIYINLRYSSDYQNLEVYAKYDIEGKICALFLDDNTSDKLKFGGTNSGVGPHGAVIKPPDRWGSNWTDKDGDKVKILTVNTAIINVKNQQNRKNSIATLLTRENFNKQLNSNFTKKQIDRLKFEDVVKIIEQINAKYTE